MGARSGIMEKIGRRLRDEPLLSQAGPVPCASGARVHSTTYDWCSQQPLPHFESFVTPAFRLLALISMAPNGFVQPVVRACDAPLGIVVIGAQTRHICEC